MGTNEAVLQIRLEYKSALWNVILMLLCIVCPLSLQAQSSSTSNMTILSALLLEEGESVEIAAGSGHSWRNKVMVWSSAGVEIPKDSSARTPLPTRVFRFWYGEDNKPIRVSLGRCTSNGGHPSNLLKS